MFSGLKSFLRRRKQTIAIASSVIVLLVGFLYFYEPASPDGVYYERSPVSEHYHWIFKDGTLFIQPEEEMPPEIFGTYCKSGTQWVWEMGIPPTKVVIKPSWFGVKMISFQFIGGHQFWPRHGFCWAFDCWNWICSHLFL
jgi:hypothetical protein